MPGAPPKPPIQTQKFPSKIRLKLDGAHTRIHAELCTQCPHSAAGCCAAPPAVAWTDIGRIASLNGIAFLLIELESGRLRPSPLGLAIQRQAPGELSGISMPARCIYLSKTGCVLEEGQRSATCNYYVCEEALNEGGGPKHIQKTRRAYETLSALYAQWDIALGKSVHSRYPQGPPWDRAFLMELKEAFEELLKDHAGKLKKLMAPPQEAIDS